MRSKGKLKRSDQIAYIVLWLLGFIGHFGGGLIHLLLVIAVIILIVQLLQGKRGL